MNRDELATAIKAACAYLNEPYVVVFGSQSILGSYDHSDLPSAATLSREVDISPGPAYVTGSAVLEEKIQVLNAAIGEDSPFHNDHDFYVEGIHKDTVVLPHGWDNRLIRFTVPGTSGTGYGHTGLCLDPIDLCVAKSIAGREKDREFVAALVHDRIISAAEVLQRLHQNGIEWPADYTGDRSLAVSRAEQWLAYLRTAPAPQPTASSELAEDLSATAQGHPRSAPAMLHPETTARTDDAAPTTAHTPERDTGPDLGPHT